MIGAVLLHGSIWTILASLVFMLVVFFALPIVAVVLAFKYVRRKKMGG